MFKGIVEFIENVDEKRYAFKTMIIQLELDSMSIIEDLLNRKGIATTILAKIII